MVEGFRGMDRLGEILKSYLGIYGRGERSNWVCFGGLGIGAVLKYKEGAKQSKRADL